MSGKGPLYVSVRDLISPWFSCTELQAPNLGGRQVSATVFYGDTQKLIPRRRNCSNVRWYLNQMVKYYKNDKHICLPVVEVSARGFSCWSNKDNRHGNCFFRQWSWQRSFELWTTSFCNYQNMFHSCQNKRTSLLLLRKQWHVWHAPSYIMYT